VFLPLKLLLEFKLPAFFFSDAPAHVGEWILWIFACTSLRAVQMNSWLVRGLLFSFCCLSESFSGAGLVLAFFVLARALHVHSDRQIRINSVGKVREVLTTWEDARADFKWKQCINLNGIDLHERRRRAALHFKSKMHESRMMNNE